MDPAGIRRNGKSESGAEMNNQICSLGRSLCLQRAEVGGQLGAVAAVVEVRDGRTGDTFETLLISRRS